MIIVETGFDLIFEDGWNIKTVFSRIDKNGLDSMDYNILEALVKNFNGGPFGLDSIGEAISENPRTVEEVYEPFLIQQGFIQRTPRGRVITQFAYRHFGLEPAKNIEDLFQIDKAN